jgi:uncharacterized damage-inducible protein DinB
MKRSVRTAFVLALCASATPLAGQIAVTRAAQSGIRADMIRQFDDAANKLVQLSEAIPQEKYSWRPAEGVRSISEVFMHVAGANYLFPQFVGVRTASPLARDAETTITDKAQVTQTLKESNENIRKVINGVAEADLDKPTNMFGRQTTYRNALLTAVSHVHEHLGQMIAYARMNGITPPWSMASN